MFQLTAARRRLALPPNKPLRDKPFQLTAARRRLVKWSINTSRHHLFQLTAARRRLDKTSFSHPRRAAVSTHSRPKAAGCSNYRCPTQNLWLQLPAARRRLVSRNDVSFGVRCFNSQPPEGGWGEPDESIFDDIVSTHSRPKAAGFPLKK